MTFTIKTRGAGGLVSAEYRCPVHGVFEVLAQRDANGDAPDEQPCPEMLDEEDFVCSDEPAPSGTQTISFALCNKPSPWTISAPHQRVKSVVPTAAVRGGDMKDRPPHMLDTRPLAEGMPMKEWKKKQRELTRARRHEQLVAKGIKRRRIQVG